MTTAPMSDLSFDTAEKRWERALYLMHQCLSRRLTASVWLSLKDGKITKGTLERLAECLRDADASEPEECVHGERHGTIE